MLTLDYLLEIEAGRGVNLNIITKVKKMLR